MQEEIKASVKDILGVQECFANGKYLGLPSMIGRNKKVVFNYNKERVWRKVSNWSSQV